jgi:hypothetical protein
MLVLKEQAYYIITAQNIKKEEIKAKKRKTMA